MKKLFFIPLALLLLSLTGCTKTNDSDKTLNKDTKKTEVVSGFSCKIEGKDFTLPDSLSYFKKDDKSFTIYAKIEIPNGQYDDFFFYVNTPIKVGDFALSHDNNPGHVQFNTNRFKSAKSEFDAFWSDNGTLSITKFDGLNLEGTFAFVASGTVNDVAKKLNITDGKFKLKLQ